MVFNYIPRNAGKWGFELVYLANCVLKCESEDHHWADCPVLQTSSATKVNHLEHVFRKDQNHRASQWETFPLKEDGVMCRTPE